MYLGCSNNEFINSSYSLLTRHVITVRFCALPLKRSNRLKFEIEKGRTLDRIFTLSCSCLLVLVAFIRRNKRFFLDHFFHLRFGESLIWPLHSLSKLTYPYLIICKNSWHKVKTESVIMGVRREGEGKNFPEGAITYFLPKNNKKDTIFLKKVYEHTFFGRPVVSRAPLPPYGRSCR